MMNFQSELLDSAKSKYHLSEGVCRAYEELPRHRFLDRFSLDYINWIKVDPSNMNLVYADTTLLLYEKKGFVSTISQPSFVLEMLELLDLRPGMKVFELGAGSGWNAAMMGHLVGKHGKVRSFEIIPEMARQARKHVAQFDLPQVEIIQGDAIQEIKESDHYDRGMFTAGAPDLPGKLFEAIYDGGKLLFVLKTSVGDLLLAMRKETDHFKVYSKMYCSFVKVTGDGLENYNNDLAQLLTVGGNITVWPQGTLDLGQKIVAGRDMIFKWE